MTNYGGCLMKFLYILLGLSISPTLMGMERPPNWPQPKQSQSQAQAQPQYQFNKQQKICAICLEDMTPGQKYTCPPCQHAMHYECFKVFSKSQTKNNCPECRANLSDAQLALLRANASGVIEKPKNENQNNTQPQEVGFLRRMMLMLSGSDNNTAVQPTPEQKIKNLTDALFEAQKRITANQEQIGQLIRQKTNFEQKLQETKREYQEFRLIKPELVRLESYKKNIEDLATKNQRLEETLQAAIAQCEALKEVRSQLSLRIAQLNDMNNHLNQRIVELQSSNNRQARVLQQQILSHDSLRRKILYATALGSGIGGGILASRYVKSYPKLAGLLSGASLLAATYWAGSVYCDDLLRWDRNNAPL